MKGTRNQENKVNVFIVNFQTGFDRIIKNKLQKIMIKEGIWEKIIERVKNIYRKISNMMEIHKRYTKEFWTNTKVRYRGHVLYPTLYSIFIQCMIIKKIRLLNPSLDNVSPEISLFHNLLNIKLAATVLEVYIFQYTIPRHQKS